MFLHTLFFPGLFSEILNRSDRVRSRATLLAPIWKPPLPRMPALYTRGSKSEDLVRVYHHTMAYGIKP